MFLITVLSELAYLQEDPLNTSHEDQFSPLFLTAKTRKEYATKDGRRRLEKYERIIN